VHIVEIACSTALVTVLGPCLRPSLRLRPAREHLCPTFHLRIYLFPPCLFPRPLSRPEALRQSESWCCLCPSLHPPLEQRPCPHASSRSLSHYIQVHTTAVPLLFADRGGPVHRRVASGQLPRHTRRSKPIQTFEFEHLNWRVLRQCCLATPGCAAASLMLAAAGASTAALKMLSEPQSQSPHLGSARR
jgi:hypothetical protein